MTLLVEELKTWGQISAKRLIPVSVLQRLRDVKRRSARKSLKKMRSDDGVLLPQTRIENDLRGLGVRPGRDIFVHSSMSKVGAVEGGAETIIEALFAVVGDEATIVMPAYPMSSTMYEWMSDPTPFDLRTSPSRMGIITEVFRKMPGVVRSAHPSHSVAAYGPRASMYTGDHHKVTKPCGPGSPFRVLTDCGGDILCLGTGVGKITNYHVVEDYLDDFPLPVYSDMRMSKEVIFEDGRSEHVQITVGNSRMSPWRVDNFKPKEMEYFRHLKSYGVVKEALVGRARTHLIDGEGFHHMMVNLVRKGVTIYHQPKLRFLSTLLQ